MLLRNVVVKIEYRMDAGPGSRPRWKALRGRVMTADATGTTYGSDLFSPTVTSIDMAVAKSLIALKHVETVTFTFGDNILLPNRAFKNGRLLGEKMVS